jgi:hypothetical protein
MGLAGNLNSRLLEWICIQYKGFTCHVYNGVSIIRIIILENKIRTSTELIAGLAPVNDDG